MQSTVKYLGVFIRMYFFQILNLCVVQEFHDSNDFDVSNFLILNPDSCNDIPSNFLLKRFAKNHSSPKLQLFTDNWIDRLR